MSEIILNYLVELNSFLGFYLDKLKLKSPLLYFLVQTTLGGLTVAFSTDKININPEIDGYIITALVMISASVNSRTTKEAKRYADNNDLPDSIDRVTVVDSGEPVSEDKSLQGL